MTIELLLSPAVIVLLGGMILLERMATPDPKFPKPVGWRAIAERADLLLAGCIVLCLTIVWLPRLFR
jgi:hypothetical protein